MSEIPRTEDNLGVALVKVQEDLGQLKSNLEKLTVNDRGTTLDIQALDNAICRTERSIRKHAEDYLKKLNKQLHVLPSIDDFSKQPTKIAQWKPSLETIPHLHSQRDELPGVSPGEKVDKKQKANTHLLSNPVNPYNRGNVTTKCVLSLPDVVKKNTNTVKHKRKMTVSGCHFPSIPEDDKRKVLQPSLLSLAVQHKVVSLHPRKDSLKTGSDSRCDEQQKWQTSSESPCVRKTDEGTPLWATETPLPSTIPKRGAQNKMLQGTSSVLPKILQSLPVEAPVNTTNLSFTIINGQIEPMASDFSHFKQNCSFCWSSVVDMLEALQELLRNFAVPVAKVRGDRLVELSRGWDNGWRKASVNNLLSVLTNQEEVLNLVSSPGQRYKGEAGIEAAAIRIQSCWRRYLARTAYLCHLRRKRAANIISISWLLRAQMHHTRKALQARRNSQLENSCSRAQHLAANWKRIQSSKRTTIHIPSLGYSQSQRLNSRRFNILQNIQISRLFDVRDKNVEVIYICPQHLGDDILDYYTSLLRCYGATDGADTRTQASFCRKRFIILTPEAVDYFPTHNLCLSTLLKYSPRTLKRIRNLIQGKQAYIVGGVAHIDDLAVADELDVPILGSDPAVFQLYSSKSEGRRIFADAKVDAPPGQGDICSLHQLHETLAQLLTQNITVQRWLFKIDSDHSGHGKAYCDTCHLNSYSWALQQYHHYGPDLWNAKRIQEPVLLRYLDEIPEWLAHYAQPAKTSCYPSWACFLKTFLRQGGVVEARPPSESVTYLTVDMLLEPGGEVTMLSCGDQLHGSCQLEAIGTTVPQTSVHPETLHSVCMCVGQACLKRLIVGYVSVDLATFLDHSTMEQKMWAVGLNIAYSDQLAMTQMLLMVTGGMLNWHTGCLEVPLPVTDKVCEHQTASKPAVVNSYAVIGSRLFHSNLFMLYHKTFFKMCKNHGIGFNMKKREGTIFALFDMTERCSIGMMTVSEDLQGALVTFARNLSVIHQEISSTKMQGETNFKELVKNIDDVLRMTVQNKRQLEDKPAA